MTRPPGDRSGDRADAREDAPTLDDREKILAAVGVPRLPPRYVPAELLGAGGMGKVYLCRDTHVGRAVAVKTLRPGASPERFEREARIQAQLEHPSIVPVHELDVEDREAPWFSMRRVRGLTLADALDAILDGDAALRARFPRRRLLTAFASVCLTVDFAHARGVLHRDLKPANIMLGDFGEVQVLDWGLACLAGEATPRRDDDPVELQGVRSATELGTLVGTPGYMAPEQVRGELDRLDARADVYALGAILFEILTLTPLHLGLTTGELIDATLAGPPERPSQRGRGDEVPPELDAICAGATAFDPADRYPSARALAEAIELYLDGDRDLALRRDLADRHEERGRAALGSLGRAGEEGRQARATAMRELGAALALAPDRTAVASAMSQLMMTPPAQVPPEVEAELRAAMTRDRGQGARLLPLTYAVWALFSPFLFWMGVRSVGWLVATAVIVASGVGAAILYLRRGVHDVGHGVVLMIVNSLAIAFMSGIFGPLVLTPTVVLATNVFVAMLGGVGRLRSALVAANVACVVLPLALELLGVIAPSTSFDGERLLVQARVVGFPPLPSMVFLVLATVVVVAMPVLLLHRARGDLVGAERRLLLQAWHLRHLVEAGPGAGGER